jgi:hypothetical protein
MPFAGFIWKGLLTMSETKDISKKRFSEFLAARLRARRSDENHTQHQSPEAKPSVSTRSQTKTAPAVDPRSR